MTRTTQKQIEGIVKEAERLLNIYRELLGKKPLELGLYQASGYHNLVVVHDGNKSTHEIVLTASTKNGFWERVYAFNKAFWKSFVVA